MDAIAAQIARASWTTAHELDFIRGIGTYAIPSDDVVPSHGLTRQQLLRRYEAAIGLRENWGSIDVVKVRVALARAINRATSADIPATV